jgi:hypothetical protein
MKKFLLIIMILIIAGMGVQFPKNVIFRFGFQKMNMQSDLWNVNMENLVFDRGDMSGSYYGLGYEFFINGNMGIAIEAGTYKQTRYTMYEEYTYDDDSSILQNLSLNINSLEFNINLLPLGYRSYLYPYLSFGGGIYLWKYEQWGSFINFEEGSINDGYANTQTVSLGGNAKAGFVIRVGKKLGLSLEVKYRYLKGKLSSEFEGFAPLDLSGLTYGFGVHFFIW